MDSSESQLTAAELDVDRDRKLTLPDLRRFRKVSWLLDECIRIPGTKIRFGLDPILGVIPYGGETVATVIGATILGDAGKKGIPIRMLFRMGGNMLLNAGVGTIPVIGDLFSVWFKSNSRNYRLLNRYIDSDHADQERGGWWPALVVFGFVGLIFLINILSWIFLSTFLLWVFQIGVTQL